MGRARLDSAFCCTFLLHLLQLTVDTHGQTCSDLDPPINYAVQTSRFSPGTEVLLHCDISNPMWWASATSCGPFATSALCPNRSSICSFNSTNIGNLFYHCCTAGDRVEDSFGTNRDCVQIQICTVVLEETLSHPPYTYFGGSLLIYLQLYAHPPPNQTHQVRFLTEAQTSDVQEVTASIFQPDLSMPLFYFEYSIKVPLVSESDLEASLFFSTEFQGVCSSTPGSETRAVSVRIRIISREETTPVTSAATSAVPSTPQISSVGPRNEDQCASNTGLIIGVIVLAVLTAALILLSVVIILYCTWLVRKHKKESSIALSSSNPGRPNTLTMAEYSRLQSQDITPSPAVTPYEVCPSDQQPRQNGSHLQRGHPGQATPLATPPSNLTQDSYRSHSGHTPLITLTPESHFSTARANIAVTTPPPPYGQMVETGYEQNQSNVEYATVGSPLDTSPPEGEGGGAGPIYNNTTISGLASNVELPGAETANQTIV